MISKNDLLEAMKDNKELEKLVDELGGVNRSAALINVVIPFMEKVVDAIKDFIEPKEM